MRRDNAYDMGGLSEYDQGYEDGKREMEREAMALVSILVRRLGGMVVISEKEAVAADWRDLHWRQAKLTQHTIYEVKGAR